ncbi:large ribosomal subunit protein eL43-like [Vulpes vulpes]|uniref:Large ribosomal subunit protein eL43-like n=1 Tax=Vulpes vulpes TaxID=9627 RepID=A0ABM4ZXR5_VULVU
MTPFLLEISVHLEEPQHTHEQQGPNKTEDRSVAKPIFLALCNLVCGDTAKHTTKVGIGKSRTCSGASLRKMVKKMEISQHPECTNSFCGKTKMKRQVVGIWHCGVCMKMKTVAGSAWTHTTTSAAKSATRKLKELKDQ